MGSKSSESIYCKKTGKIKKQTNKKKQINIYIMMLLREILRKTHNSIKKFLIPWRPVYD